MQYCSCITNSEKNNTPKPLECFFVKRQNSAIVGFYFSSVVSETSASFCSSSTFGSG